MHDFSNIVKKSLLIGIFCVLFIPLIQNTFNVFKTTYPLEGDVRLPSDVEFKKENWFSGEFQSQKEEYLNSMFGFRSLFVRLNNQIAYSIFNKAKAKGVIIGKENYMYEINYINGYTGLDYIGNTETDSLCEKIKFISDTLHKLNKELIIVFAAGKASFYPEYIPNEYLPKKGISNYEALSKKINRLGISNIDFNKWFMNNKYKAKYPLYPQHGVHWSWYGAALAADSLINYIESKRNIDIPNLKIKSIELDDAKYGDEDIANGMNLLFKFKSFKMAYPDLKTEDESGKTKPSVLVISDSFYWTMYNLGITKSFKDSHFWYYNKQVFPKPENTELIVSQLNLGDEIKNHEVFIIMASETSIKEIGWGSIKQFSDFFKGKSSPLISSKTPEYIAKLKEIIAIIKSNTQWLSDTESRAKEKGISLDSSLVLEAMWQIDNSKK